MYVLFSPFGRIAPRGASARIDKDRWQPRAAILCRACAESFALITMEPMVPYSGWNHQITKLFQMSVDVTSRCNSGMFPSIAAGHWSGHRQMHRHGVDQVTPAAAVSQPEIQNVRHWLCELFGVRSRRTGYSRVISGFLYAFWTSFDISWV